MTLGSIERPSSDQYVGKRKLLLVPLIAVLPDEQAFQPLVSAYWSQVTEQVQRLESGLGSILHIFHEGVVVDGTETLDMLEQGSPDEFGFLGAVCERGAQMKGTEDTEALLETLDIQRCLMVAQASAKVAKQLYGWYTDALKRRYAFMAKRIDEVLGPAEVGLLVIGQDHRIQFSDDMQVFYVAPPALNDIERWMRDRSEPASPLEEEHVGDGQETSGDSFTGEP